MHPDELRRVAESMAPALVPVERTAEGWHGKLAIGLEQVYRTVPSGLLLPERYTAPANPIDQVSIYLTPEEVFGFEVPVEYLDKQMQALPLRETLEFAARIMATLRNPGSSRPDVDREFTRLWFDEPIRSKVLNLLGGSERRILIAPQAVMCLVKIALLVSPENSSEEVRSGLLPVYLLTAAGLIGSTSPETSGDNVIHMSPGALGRELISNQHFNSEFDALNHMARSFHRWFSDGSALADTFEAATGVPIQDVMTVGIAIWSRAVNGDLATPVTFFREAGWSDDRTESALAILSTSTADLRQLVEVDVREFGIEWSVNALERFPVIRVDNEWLLPIDPAYVVRRTFGWPTYWDVMNGKINKATKDRFGSEIRNAAERYVCDIFKSLCGDPARLYLDNQLRPKLGMSKNKVADLAVDYGDAWVVAEITTSVLRRESLAGVSDEDVEQDLDKFVAKVAQIDSTIDQLRTDSRRLTGHAVATRAMTYYPVLVLAEGFPVNPISLTIMRERVKAAGLLAGKDTAPLEILDTIEIEIIEGLQESGGPTLRDLLESKRTAGMWRASMRQYILVELRLKPRRSARLDRLCAELFELIIEPFRP